MTENQTLETPMELVQYLYSRLAQLGIGTVYGSLFEWDNSIVAAASKAGLKYARSFNEVHAAFAADAYARVKGISALITTHSSPESTANDILFEAHADNIPVVHIVGYTSTKQDENREIIRQLLRQGQIGSIDQAFAYSSVVVLGIFDHIAYAPRRIDDALSDCLISSRPVYIGFPMAYAKCLVEGNLLQSPVFRAVPRNDPKKEEHVTEVVLRYLVSAKDPVIIVDGGVIRQAIQSQVQEFVKRTKLPTFVTIEGRHAIDVSLPNHGGLYAGLQSAPGIKERVDTSDLVIQFGALKTHVNTTRHLHFLKFHNKIEIYTDEHLVGRTMSYGLRARDLLNSILGRLDEVDLNPGPVPQSGGIDDPLHRLDFNTENDDEPITRDVLCLRIMKWMRDGDLLISHFPIEDAQNYVHHPIWERKDVSFGACLGACCSASELGSASRVIVLIDSASFKHASRELATILSLGLCPIVFVCRREPLTEDSDDDSVEERFANLADPDCFAPDLRAHGLYKGYSISTMRQLGDLLASEKFASPICAQLVELILHTVRKTTDKRISKDSTIVERDTKDDTNNDINNGEDDDDDFGKCDNVQ